MIATMDILAQSLNIKRHPGEQKDSQDKVDDTRLRLSSKPEVSDSDEEILDDGLSLSQINIAKFYLKLRRAISLLRPLISLVTQPRAN